MEQLRTKQELKEKLASLELKRKESEFFLQKELNSVVDSYSPTGILDAVMENNRVSRKKWLVLAAGMAISAVLRKYLFQPSEEPENNFLRSIVTWFRESNDDLIDKGLDYVRDWIKGHKK